MAVRVLLPNAFQKHTNNTREMSSAAANLPELITEIEDIRFLGNEKYSFQEGDEVLVIPSIAGG
jgi:molybdopterin converting factor small subunit